jgi:hypothetical protein
VRAAALFGLLNWEKRPTPAGNQGKTATLHGILIFFPPYQFAARGAAVCCTWLFKHFRFPSQIVATCYNETPLPAARRQRQVLSRQRLANAKWRE